MFKATDAQQAIPADKFALRANLRLNCGVGPQKSKHESKMPQPNTFWRASQQRFSKTFFAVIHSRLSTCQLPS